LESQVLYVHAVEQDAPRLGIRMCSTSLAIVVFPVPVTLAMPVVCLGITLKERSQDRRAPRVGERHAVEHDLAVNRRKV
jgi:hypothetical protein